MRSAMRSADMPGPGRRFGHEVTMRQRFVCARAMEGAARRGASDGGANEVAACELGHARLLPPGVEMMHRAVAVADGEFVRMRRSPR